MNTLVLGSACAAFAIVGTVVTRVRARTKAAIVIAIIACAAAPFASRQTPAPERGRPLVIRELCARTADQLALFRADAARYTPDDRLGAEIYFWSGMTTELGDIDRLCLPLATSTSCIAALFPDVDSDRFLPRLDALIHAYQTGEPCPQ